jgi:hypothetical protein
VAFFLIISLINGPSFNLHQPSNKPANGHYSTLIYLTHATNTSTGNQTSSFHMLLQTTKQ